jgi:EamA domain-containing membrane protein RarD
LKPILIAGTVIVHFALIAYSVAIITEQRRHRVTPMVLWVLTGGVIFDIVATACMITGSEKSPFTLHGILGYSSLTMMLLDAVFIWRFHGRSPNDVVPRPLHLYSRLAYSWWIIAYLTGAALVFIGRRVAV